ncbi:hypothetical protein PSE_1206 [Pseudovibrio sp. FO-BEG1]|uniref:hypothetical protein n=1 Tax=Pseudovibrio sp. (strain FO-BEG1) TaxID=911045 RepID=UPI000238CFCE|nr:hypothetical protein [Pseudovibrio sp. FO-BEG1]AEV35718.1 hypothetical protein PSE_1206 [Pseudovibrio sp. FO-BEG1]
MSKDILRSLIEIFAVRFFELEAKDITDLNDSDLRELVGRLCEAEIISQNLATSKINWGGAQEAADDGLDVFPVEVIWTDRSIRVRECFGP